MREEIKKEVLSITPLDALEEETISNVVAWIDTNAEIYRTKKPSTPPKHLVSYFVVIDGEYLLLVDHINAEKWLPTGGHVELGEHPKETVVREAYEELKIKASFIQENPVLITSTETVGKTAGHTDISLWYTLRGDRSAPTEIDTTEFHQSRWFHKSQLPSNTDPHLARFVEKFYNS